MKRLCKKGDVITIGKGTKQFLVTETKMTGGGTGHGLHDVYPDGHQVTCVALDPKGKWNPKGTRKSFYQTGCFHGMIEPEKIELVGKMKELIKWVKA